jgi:hypothetical protein
VHEPVHDCERMGPEYVHHQTCRNPIKIEAANYRSSYLFSIALSSLSYLVSHYTSDSGIHCWSSLKYSLYDCQCGVFVEPTIGHIRFDFTRNLELLSVLQRRIYRSWLWPTSRAVGQSQLSPFISHSTWRCEAIAFWTVLGQGGTWADTPGPGSDWKATISAVRRRSERFHIGRGTE